MQTIEYAPGRSVDLFGDPAQPAVLLWHGMQANARAVLRPLASMLAGFGVAVVAPDWNSHADDGGRADLLASLDFIRRRASDIVLVGWSMGGAAAAGLTLGRRDVPLAHTVCLAGAFMAPDPVTGRSVTDVVPVMASREFATSLGNIGWSVELVELAADHGSIAGADYDPVADRYLPGTSAPAQRMAGEVAARIAATLGR